MNSDFPLFHCFLLLLAAVSIGAKNNRVKIGFLIAMLLFALLGAPEKFGLG